MSDFPTLSQAEVDAAKSVRDQAYEDAQGQINPHRPLTVYYAHPTSDYGENIEAHDLRILNKLGYEVVNPNHPDHVAAYEKHGMEYFKLLVGNCDALAFRAFKGDHTIGAGVGAEIRAAERAGLPIFELPYISQRILSVEDTKSRLRWLKENK